MSEMKSKQIRALRELTESGLRHHPEMSAGSDEAVGGRTMGGLMEGYALYGAVLYPPLMHWVTDASPYGRRALGHGHRNRMHGPGDAANEINVNDNLHAISPGARDATIQAPETGVVSTALRLSVAGLKAGAGCLQRLWSHIRREREIAQAIALLSSLDDHTLHDIGIHRSQVAHVARHGLDDSGRVRSPGV